MPGSKFKKNDKSQKETNIAEIKIKSFFLFCREQMFFDRKDQIIGETQINSNGTVHHSKFHSNSSNNYDNNIIYYEIL